MTRSTGVVHGPGAHVLCTSIGKDPIKSRSQLAGSQDFAIEDEICDTQVIPLVEIFEECSFNEKEEVIGKILFGLI